MRLKSLTREQIRQLVDSVKIFQRGEGYHQSGKVTRCTTSGASVTAKVRGTYGLYTVKIEETPEGLILDCDCPYDGYVCKHIVAVLLRYLEGEYEEIEPLETAVPAALKQTLEGLSHQALLGLVLKLAGERGDFRHVLLENVSISPQVMMQQPRQPRQVAHLKREITDFFNEQQYRWEYGGYGDYHEYDDFKEHEDLESVFEVAVTLNPEDQIEVFWHVATCADELLDEDFIGTTQIQQALELYGAVVERLNLSHHDKRPHFDRLLAVLHWKMCNYEYVVKTIKKALDGLCTTKQDYGYLIRQLKKSGYQDTLDWIAGYHLQLGDEANYLEVRLAHMESEAQHVELAEFWYQRGDVEKYVSVLEAYLSKLLDQHAEAQPYRTYARPHGFVGIFERLTDHYQERQDTDNLCRILMAKAQCTRVTLDLYRQIETVATRLKKWPKLRRTLIDLTNRDPTTLAQIYLYEEDWEAAVRLARKSEGYHYGYDEMHVLVAEGVKQHRPEAAVEIYQQLVQGYIEKGNRQAYQVAANFAAKVKSIFLVTLKDKRSWQDYIGQIRTRYPRRRALQEEFQEL